ncbi:MAG: hypothetical protein IPN77_30745 [Sandaracinaceae bacterium]|nr:hypothetical protein [Sandaracinaceae bacterium]
MTIGLQRKIWQKIAILSGHTSLEWRETPWRTSPCSTCRADEIRGDAEEIRHPSAWPDRAKNPFNIGAIIRTGHSFLARDRADRQRAAVPARAAMGMQRYENIVEPPAPRRSWRTPREQWPLVAFEKDASSVGCVDADLPGGRGAGVRQRGRRLRARDPGRRPSGGGHPHTASTTATSIAVGRHRDGRVGVGGTSKGALVTARGAPARTDAEPSGDSANPRSAAIVRANLLWWV